MAAHLAPATAPAPAPAPAPATAHAPPVPGSVSETARERETFTFDDLGISTATLCSPETEKASHKLIPSSVLSSTPDPALTAFAQLGLYRLNAAHTIVSLFDRTYQHFVAEAIRCAPLNNGSPGAEEQLVFCGPAIPRTQSICEHVLTGSAEGASIPGCDTGTGVLNEPANLPVSVITNLDLHPKFYLLREMDKDRRFYAGVPIRSPTGINIGVYCVFDNKPRPEGLTKDQIQFVRDISKTVMDYLQAKRSNEWYRREERMVRGLGSFVEGQATLSNWSASPDQSSFRDIPGVQEGTLNKKLRSSISQPPSVAHTHHARKRSHEEHPRSIMSATRGDEAVSVPMAVHNSSRVASADLLQGETERVFSKASNIIRESIEVEGVLFLDASVRTFGGRIGQEVSEPPILETVQSSESSSDESQNGQPPISTEQHSCNVLGFSTSRRSSINDHDPLPSHADFPERLIQKLLQRYPHGRIFNFDRDGAGMDYSGMEVDRFASVSPFYGPAIIPTVDAVGDTPAKPSGRRLSSQQDLTNCFLRMFPGARSVAFVPLYDGQKNRWFAAGFVWTKTPTRIFTQENELSYLRVFGLATMAEVARLSTRAADRTKTDILGSISHELRSPLHGVVGAVEMLRNTVLDEIQENILRTIETSGRTLLDTIDHLLDYSKISNLVRASKADRRNSVLDPCASPNSGNLRTPQLHVHIDRLVEEVVESVLAGWSYRNMSDAHFAAWHSFVVGSQQTSSRDPKTTAPSGPAQAGSQGPEIVDPVQIYLDIDPSVNWSFQTHPGAFRRIVMNLLGNSLKFTRTGFIRISLRQELFPSGQRGADPRVILTVSDSGKGISQEYLRRQLFTPFSQEDHFAPGTGLGLSLVRQMAVSLGGSVDVSSHVGHGTTVTVSLPLPPSVEDHEDEGIFRDEALFQQHIQVLTGCRVYLRGFDTVAKVRDGFCQEDTNQKSQLKLMESVCHGWLHMDVMAQNSDTKLTDRDFVLVLKDGSERVAAEDEPDLALCPHLFICQDSSASYALSKPSIYYPQVNFSYLAMPIGPRKLADALLASRLRWKDVLRATTESSAARTPLTGPFPSPLSAPGGWLSNTPPVAFPFKTETPIDNSHLSVPSVPPEVILPVEVEPVPTPPVPSPAGPELLLPSLMPQPEIMISVAGGADSTNLKSPDLRPSVLIVDDNIINLKILEAYMTKLKYPHTTAMNGREAVEIYTKSPGEYRCILTDISMPIMDGLESTRRIREFERANHLKSVVVIALTGLSGADIQQDAFVSGVDLFLTRPLIYRGLVKALETTGVKSVNDGP
ncbi:hsp90-like protein [Podospora appendiculata]|uniref:histidine kinase n=1 Tax=Podospora appendiculata TaxID=314037 RepID=A0AAE0X0L0_9PEZI|nr:hsp90-like protein [Podospora appendiculata]